MTTPDPRAIAAGLSEPPKVATSIELKEWAKANGLRLRVACITEEEASIEAIHPNGEVIFDYINWPTNWPEHVDKTY